MNLAALQRRTQSSQLQAGGARAAAEHSTGQHERDEDAIIDLESDKSGGALRDRSHWGH